MKLTVNIYMDIMEEVEVQEIAPGLAFARFPAVSREPYYTLFHVPSSSKIKTVRTQKTVKELAGRISPLLDWTRNDFTSEELQPAALICREYRL